MLSYIPFNNTRTWKYIYAHPSLLIAKGKNTETYIHSPIAFHYRVRTDTNYQNVFVNQAHNPLESCIWNIPSTIKIEFVNSKYSEISIQKTLYTANNFYIKGRSLDETLLRKLIW